MHTTPAYLRSNRVQLSKRPSKHKRVITCSLQSSGPAALKSFQSVRYNVLAISAVSLWHIITSSHVWSRLAPGPMIYITVAAEKLDSELDLNFVPPVYRRYWLEIHVMMSAHGSLENMCSMSGLYTVRQQKTVFMGEQCTSTLPKKKEKPPPLPLRFCGGKERRIKRMKGDHNGRWT